MVSQGSPDQRGREETALRPFHFCFPDRLYQALGSWAERAYPDNLDDYNELDRGDHFAAGKQPELFISETRAAFRSLR